MILITGAAGFIGFHLSKKLLEQGNQVIGYDNVNDYYDKQLKEDRLSILNKYKSFIFHRNDLLDINALNSVFKNNNITNVIHLAAQAGVRYSLTNPKAYIDSNIYGFLNMIEQCRNFEIDKFIYASSSSVYGMNKKTPFLNSDNVDHPISLYGASKRSNELIAHSYSYLYNIKSIGLRFFTVYGPFGRPDMALFLFTKSILNNKKIDVYNNGQMKRDFTYIDDIINGIIAILTSDFKFNTPSKIDSSTSLAPYRIFNIGNNAPVNLMDFITEIENQLGLKAKINFMPLQPGDVLESHADVDNLIKNFNYRPSTSIGTGIEKFINWYKEYYKI